MHNMNLMHNVHLKGESCRQQSTCSGTSSVPENVTDMQNNSCLIHHTKVIDILFSFSMTKPMLHMISNRLNVLPILLKLHRALKESTLDPPRTTPTLAIFNLTTLFACSIAKYIYVGSRSIETRRFPPP